MKTVLRRKASLIYLTCVVMLALLLTLGLQTGLHAVTVAEEDIVAQTGAISGRVTASDGGDLGALKVRAIDKPNGIHASEITLDATGRYTLTELPPDTYEVTFNENNEGLYLREKYNNKSFFDFERGDLVTVTASRTITGINAELQLGGMIQGRVTSELTGKPLAGISISAEGGDLYVGNSTYSDANGVYTITGLMTDNYKVIFNTLIDWDPNYVIEYYADRSTFDTSDAVAVTAGVTTSGINAALTPLYEISGKLEEKYTHTPLDSVYVTAYDVTGQRRGWEDYSDDTGQYTITGLAPGAYRIRFGGIESFALPYYSNRLLFEEADWITITPGADVRQIDAALISKDRPDGMSLKTAATRPGVFLYSRGPHFDPQYSLDGAKSWHEFPTLPSHDQYFAPQIALVPKDDPMQPVRFIFASSAPEAGDVAGIYRTADGGVSWARFTPPSDPNCIDFSVDDLATSPTDPLRVYAAITCYVQDFEGYGLITNLYTSADGGVTWKVTPVQAENSSSGKYKENNLVLLPSPVEPGRVYFRSTSHSDPSSAGTQWRRSDNGGETWLTESFSATALALDWKDAAKLYVVQDTYFTLDALNVYRYTGKRSTDAGVTWTVWAQQPCPTSFRQLLALPLDDTLLMICDQGLYRSRNGGDEWEIVSTQSGESLVVDAGDRSRAIWLQSGDWWASRDQGTTWTRLGDLNTGLHTMRLPDVRRP